MKGKRSSTATALFLVISIAATMMFLPASTAQTTSTKKTYAFIGAMPNPVGIGQEVLLHVGISDPTAWPQTGWSGLTVTVTKPDGTTQTIGPVDTDTTGGSGTVFVPNMVGNYTLQTNFPEQICTVAAQSVPKGCVMLASQSPKMTLVVTEAPVQYYPGQPLPNFFWTRPIDAQLFEWSGIAGNWLFPQGSYTMPPINKVRVGNDDAPETGHVLWTKQLAEGGMVGGELGNRQYEMGDAYEGFYLGTVVINGVLYYNQYKSNGGTAVEQQVVAVDLHTGKELWVRNWNNTRLSHGQVFFWDSYNYHGAFDYLWTVSGTTWNAYDAFTGRWEYSMTGVPSGTNMYGPKGEIYRYTVNLGAGSLTLWNSSRVGANVGSWGSAVTGRTLNASTGIMWNVSIPRGLPGSTVFTFLHDKIIGTTAGGMGTKASTITNWGISVKPGQEGQLIYNKTWNCPEGNITWVFTDASAQDDVMILSAKETLNYYGFSMSTGDMIWATEPEHYLQIYDKWYGPAVGYGKLFAGRTAGIVYCYDLKTGKTLWTYDVTDPYTEILWGNSWPIGFHFLTDGKIYLGYMEHKPQNPNARGAPFVCLNATTGEEIFVFNMAQTYWGGNAVIGDSIIAEYNMYDQRIYALGKGPSAISIKAPDVALQFGESLVLKGMVTDISPGLSDYSITARFPEGVPLVADEGMSEWMQYVHMQFERPKNATGVTITLSVLDANGNYRDIGTTTSDLDGFYKFKWTPDIPGEYKVYASFAGSKSYYPSQAVTAFAVEEQVPPDTSSDTTNTVTLPPIEAYFVGATVAIILAVAIVGFLLLRKRP